MQSQQQPQPQQQQQPVYVYPNTFTPPGLSNSSSHSNGSFGTVFIVLAVIIVISGFACCLGRLCNRKLHKEKKPTKQKHKMKGGNGPKERENDLEFGFDKRIAAGKPAGLHGEPPSRGFKMPGNGDFRFEPKHPGGDIEFKPGAMHMNMMA